MNATTGIQIARLRVDLQCLVTDLLRLSDQAEDLLDDAAVLATEMDALAEHIRRFLAVRSLR
jgi:hypothetical protein